MPALQDQENPAFDCRSCGACCRGRAGTVLVDLDDLERWRQARRSDLEFRLEPGHFSLPALPSDVDGRCLYQGPAQHPHDCSIYELRPQSCRDFAVGSKECLRARAFGRRD